MPIITLITDFGTADPYVGEIKGVLVSASPDVRIVDVSHAVPPGDLKAGAFILGRVWRRFPLGTVHLIVVDPGVGTARAALACRSGGHLFVAPDNGVLTPVLGEPGAMVVALPTPEAASFTFHGRDLFAPAAAALAGGIAVERLGVPHAAPVRLESPSPFYQGKTVVGEVIYVDRFGNLVTNLGPEEAPAYGVLEAEDTVIGPLHRTFGDVKSGEIVAYFGSGGTVEIAVRDGSAARRLGLGVGGEVRVRLG